MGEEIGSEMALRTFGHLVSLINLCYLFCNFCSSKPNMSFFARFYYPSLYPFSFIHYVSRTWICILSLSLSHSLALSLSLSLPLSLPPHQLRYGEPTLRRAVPLALALISVSNPRLNILDTLSKFSHDADPEVSHNSIFAMGMVGSGKPRFK